MASGRPGVAIGVALEARSSRLSLRQQLDGHLRLLATAEGTQLEGVWIGEGFGAGMPAPFQWLAALASHTSLPLGTGVVLLPAWHPLRLAHEATVADHLTRGNFSLGVGLGSSQVHHRFGVDSQTVGRYADDVLAALGLLWSGAHRVELGHVTVDGPLSLRPLTPGGPPIWVGGSVRASVRRAAKFGVGWYGSTNAPMAKLSALIDMYRQELTENDRVGRVAINRLVLVADTQVEADSLGARYLGPQVRKYVLDGSLGFVPSSITARAAFRQWSDDLLLVGDLERVRAKIGEYASMGVTNLIARVGPGDTPVGVAAQTIAALAEVATSMADSDG